MAISHYTTGPVYNIASLMTQLVTVSQNLLEMQVGFC